MAKVLKDEHVADVYNVSDLIDVLKRLNPRLPVLGGFRDNLTVKHIRLEPDHDEAIDDPEFICIEEI